MFTFMPVRRVYCVLKLISAQLLTWTIRRLYKTQVQHIYKQTLSYRTDSIYVDPFEVLYCRRLHSLGYTFVADIMDLVSVNLI